MISKNMVAFGIYLTREAVENGVRALQVDGFQSEDISVLFPHKVGSENFAERMGTKVPDEEKPTATGAVAGAAFGGLIVGIGALAIPGIGLLLAAGPIMATLAALGASAAPDAISHALTGMGIPKFEADHYEGLVKKGGVFLSVHSDNSESTRRAKEILERTGAENISSSGDAKATTARS